MKLHLTIDRGTLAGRRYDLETGFLTIGRSETCSIRFDPNTERIASKQHAFIEAKVDGYYLTDNNSTNGTLLNGRKISVERLGSGDQIQFGTDGVTATVEIEDANSFATRVAPKESFREYQVQQFNQLAAQVPAAGFHSSLAGLGSAAVKTEPSRGGRTLGIIFAVLSLIFLALVVIMLMFLSVGVGPAIVAAVIAFAPVLIYLLPLIWLDRYDPEPFWLLVLAFVWGAVVAVFVSFIINSALGAAVALTVSDDAGEAVGAVLSAPIFEEGSKGLGLIILLVFFRRYFDDILDGIVFAGVIAFGFATVENVLYYGDAYRLRGWDGVKVLFLLRGILSPFAHATFTSMTGIGCGISRESHKKGVKILAPIAGYLVAVLLHATWNSLAGYSIYVFRKVDVEPCSLIGLPGLPPGLCSFLISYCVLQIPLFLTIVGFAMYIMRRQNKILKEMLAIDIARGLIPQDHARKAMSAFRSSGWVVGGLFVGKFRARSNYVRSIGKLGLSYWHIQRATAAQGETGSFQQNPILRDAVLK
jgi:RsiW-degrading membrane proteinase PrsW (M82 family)